MIDEATPVASPQYASRVLGVPPARHAAARDHFQHRLQCETDPYDVYHDLEAGVASLVVLDVRRPAAYAAGHVPGARNIPHQDMTPETLDLLDPAAVYVTYGWGPGCNGGVRAGAHLAAHGLLVKEMMGGLEYWERQGYPVERSAA
ncbi:rhodanese-like domain-containing protein [Micromonospora sp. CA-246542]|uniref:rhodanese-like domain-containing protein n=1 Tax=Micromonospora sp. CA-246542 TaxID=3239959 RepID=UPI003D8D3EAF